MTVKTHQLICRSKCYSCSQNKLVYIKKSYMIWTLYNKDNLSNPKHFSKEDARRIGEVLGIDWSKFDVEQFRMGLDVELEHGIRDEHTNVTHDDEIATGKIALAHLNEFPDYYSRLKKMEDEANEFYNK